MTNRSWGNVWAGLGQNGREVEVFENPHQALKRIQEKTFDIVVTDIRMEDIDGIEILEKVKAKSDQTKVIMITGYATVEVAREALGKGAFDFIAKPLNPTICGKSSSGPPPRWALRA